MATMTTESINLLIKHDGHIPSTGPLNTWDNPRAIKIVTYQNKWGGISHGVIFEGEPDPYKYERESEFIIDPKVTWVYEA